MIDLRMDKYSIGNLFFILEIIKFSLKKMDFLDMFLNFDVKSFFQIIEVQHKRT
jgi:hypothetical protein